MDVSLYVSVGERNLSQWTVVCPTDLSQDEKWCLKSIQIENFEARSDLQIFKVLL